MLTDAETSRRVRTQARRGLWMALAWTMGVLLVALAMERWPDLVVPLRAGERFDAAQARVDLDSIVGDGTPRVVGTDAARAGRDRIAGILESLGLSVERHAVTLERGLPGGPVALENLVVRVPGTRGGEGARIALVAHSDSVPGSPGAGDDGAGVASLVGVARALRARPPVHDILLLVTDGEERGLLGARAFEATHPAAAAIELVVNLDARGAAGPAMVYETGPQSAWLADRMAQALSAPRTQSLAVEAYRRMPNGSDFTVFLRAGRSGCNVAFIGDVAAYHSPQDTPQRLQDATLAHMGQTALELVRAFDAALPAQPGAIPPGRAVWGDVLGLGILRWPEEATRPIALVAAAMLAICVVGTLLAGARRADSTTSVRAAAAAVLGAGGVILAGGCIGWLFQIATRTLEVNMVNAPLRIAGMLMLLWIAAALLVVALGALLARRVGAGPLAAAVGAWTPWIALAVAAAWLLPGISLPLVVPCVAAGVSAAAARVRRGRDEPPTQQAQRIGRWCALGGYAAAALVWIPLEMPLLDALGMGIGALHGAAAALVLLGALPLVVGAVGERAGAGS